jgi:hypothetical protein
MRRCGTIRHVSRSGGLPQCRAAGMKQDDDPTVQARGHPPDLEGPQPSRHQPGRRRHHAAQRDELRGGGAARLEELGQQVRGRERAGRGLRGGRDAEEGADGGQPRGRVRCGRRREGGCDKYERCKGRSGASVTPGHVRPAPSSADQALGRSPGAAGSCGAAPPLASAALTNVRLDLPAAKGDAPIVGLQRARRSQTPKPASRRCGLGGINILTMMSFKCVSDVHRAQQCWLTSCAAGQGKHDCDLDLGHMYW